MANIEYIDIPDIVAFDLDGTLTTQGTVGRLCAKYAENATARALVLCDKFYRAARFVKDSINDDFHIGSETKRRILSVIAKPREGAAEMVDGIKHLGVSVTLLSNGPKDAWGKRISRHFNLGSGFDQESFREDLGKELKPSPSGLLNQIQSVNTQSDSAKVVWMVGDQISDMLTAIAANNSTDHKVIPVAMGEDSPAAEFLRQSCECTHMIARSCDDILETVQVLKTMQAFMPAPTSTLK